VYLFVVRTLIISDHQHTMYTVYHVTP